MLIPYTHIARVAELVDALDLGSSGVTCESSSLSSRKIIIKSTGSSMEKSQHHDVSVNGLKYSLKADIATEPVKRVYTDKLNELMAGYQLKGFRKGKVPKSVIEKRFGSALVSDVIKEAVDKDFSKFMQDQSVTLANQPTIEVTKADLDKALAYKAEFEVFPKLDYQTFETIGLKNLSVTVSKEDKAAKKQNLMDSNPEWVECANGDEIQDEFKVIVDFEGKIDDKEFEGSEAKDYEIELGKKQMLEAFEKGLIGSRVGENLTGVEVSFPDDYYREDLRGKKALFDIKVKQAWLPEKISKVADLLKKISSDAKTWKDYDDELTNKLNREALELKRVIDQKNLVTAVSKHFNLDLPESMLEEKRKELATQKLEGDALEKEAKEQVLLTVVFSQLVKHLEVKISDDDLDEYFDEILPGFANKSQLREIYKSDRNSMAKLEGTLLERKMLTKVYEAYAKDSESYTIEEAKKLLEQGD